MMPPYHCTPGYIAIPAEESAGDYGLNTPLFHDECVSGLFSKYLLSGDNMSRSDAELSVDARDPRFPPLSSSHLEG